MLLIPTRKVEVRNTDIPETLQNYSFRTWCSQVRV
jgi:hypothetical protein